MTELGRLPPAAAYPARRVTPSASMAGGMEVELRSYIDILRRRSGWVRGVFVAVLAIALGYTLLQDRVYRATALLEIRGGDGGVPAVDGLFSDRNLSEEDLRTHFGMLKSTALATRVIRTLRLDTLEEFSADGETPMSVMAQAFVETLVVDPVEESRLVSVSFDASSPELAASIVNSVVAAYATVSVESRENAARLLAQQVDSVEAALEESEETLLKFAVVNDLPYLVEEDATAHIGARITDLQGRLTDAQGARYESESLNSVVNRDGRVDVLKDEVLDALMMQLSDLRTEYARVSATFTDDYPATAEVRRQIEHVEGLIEEERGRLAARVESEFQLSVKREQSIAAALDAEEEVASALGPESGRYHVLRQSVLANRTLLATLNDQRRHAEVAASIGPTDFAVVDRALPPMEPHRPLFMINVALGVMLALTLGVGAAFTRELLDDTVHSADDLRVPESIPVLALIPSLANGDAPLQSRSGRLSESQWPRIDTLSAEYPGRNALVDSFGTLRTAVLFEDSDSLPCSILVTSCRPGEGKTTVSVNLAMSLARLGKRVLLIDADLRRPSVHRAFRINPGPGLVTCLNGDEGWLSARRQSGITNVHVLPAGEPGSAVDAGPGAADLLSGAALETLLREAEALYDFVLVDAPALFINAADARLLARQVDGTIVVLRSRSTPKALVERIPQALPNVIGFVVNDLLTSSLPNYGGDYFTGHDHAPEEEGVGMGSGASAARSSDPLARLGHWIQAELQRT